MRVQELEEILSILPSDSEISVFWDGGVRGAVEGIVSIDGEVVIVGDWSIYREAGPFQAYPEENILYG